MHIACAADSKFLPHCAAMLYSLLRSQKADTVTVHFLHDGDVPEQSLSRLNDLVQSNAGVLNLVPVSDRWREACPGNRRFGQVAWYRVLLPELLPEIDRTLYLDADTIVRHQLDELWNSPLDGCVVGAVANPLYPFMNPGFLDELGVLPEQYFNSGMLLFDMDAWRNEGLTRKVLERAATQRNQEWPDQNALNFVLKKQWKPLHPKWNSQNTIFDLHASQLPFLSEEIQQARRDPAVLHFIGPYKPWHYRCKHRMRSAYWQNISHTPWGEYPIEGRNLRNALLRLLPEIFSWRLESWWRTRIAVPIRRAVRLK